MARNHYPPEKPITRPIGSVQMDLLRRIVATNGGGVSIYGENDRVVAGLVNRHLIQGKRGQSHRMVHTPLGLRLVRDAEAIDRELSEGAFDCAELTGYGVV